MTVQWWLGYLAGISTAGIVALCIYIYRLWVNLPSHLEFRE